MFDQLSLRDRIFVLLVGAIVLGAASSGVSIWTQDEVARRGRNAARLELEVSQTLGQVAVSHLEQTAALERALWERRPAEGPSPAERRFEERAAVIWAGLQEVTAQLSTSAAEPGAGDLSAPVTKLDLAHNDYADGARAVFAALAAGRRDLARVRARAAESQSHDFQNALGEVLALASERADAKLARLEEEQRSAIQWVSLLTASGLLAGAAVLYRAMQLVSRIRSLSGLVPICATCKSIRDDRGYWNQLEEFVEKNSEAQFTHGVCEPCLEKLKAETKAA